MCVDVLLCNFRFPLKISRDLRGKVWLTAIHNKF